MYVIISFHLILLCVNVIVGILPFSAISGLSWLRVFVIKSQQTTGPLPPFTSHPALYHLEISHTYFVGGLPRVTRNTSIPAPYPKIIITNNELITGISTEAQQAGNAERFTEIDLSRNKFTSDYFTFLPTTVETFICQSCHWEGNLNSLTPERVAKLQYVDLQGDDDDSSIKRGLYGSIAPLFHPTASRLQTAVLSLNKFSLAMENNTALPAPANCPKRSYTPNPVRSIDIKTIVATVGFPAVASVKLKNAIKK